MLKVLQSPNYATAQTPRQDSPNYLHVCKLGSQVEGGLSFYFCISYSFDIARLIDM